MKKFFLILLFFGFFLNANALAGCIKGDCKNGYGEYAHTDGSKYSGNWIKGKASGQGKIEYSDGEFYEGSFYKNKRHGYGTYKFNNGDVAVGEFKKNDFKSVKYTYADGSYCPDMGKVKYGCRVEIVKKNNSLQNNSTDIASMIDQAKDTCKSLGFKEGTEKFTDCSLKLYSQSLDLAAKQNQQVVIQNQGSSSDTVRVIDVTRERENTLRKAGGLIDGSCTLATYYKC